MDQLKGLAGKVGGGSGEQKPAAGGEQKDYLDKGKSLSLPHSFAQMFFEHHLNLQLGLEAGEKQFGVNAGSGTNEKITDKGREMFEKQTG